MSSGHHLRNPAKIARLVLKPFFLSSKATAWPGWSPRRVRTAATMTSVPPLTQTPTCIGTLHFLSAAWPAATRSSGGTTVVVKNSPMHRCMPP